MLSGMYWGLTAAALMRRTNEITSKDEVSCNFINECYDEKSSLFAGAYCHDGHVTFSLSAIQIFVLYDCLREELSVQRAKKMPQKRLPSYRTKKTGAAPGDEWGEVDTRFSYCAFSALSLLTHGMGEECFLDWNLEEARNTTRRKRREHG